MTQQHDFKSQFERLTGQANTAIVRALDAYPDMHPRINEALRYTLEAPGKRLRAVMVLLCSELVSGKTNPAAQTAAQTAAAAIEMVHTYSLVHDDLPAMDDDDFRRGRPSCHKQFDEPTAILAGDALLTLAFDLLASQVSDPAVAVKLIRALAQAAGASGMIAGQMADLQAENSGGDLTTLEYIHINKTARMFIAACRMGAICGSASDTELAALDRYGLSIGLGFQIADDILDVSSSSEQLGKTAGKDIAQGKLTYPSLVGLENSRAIAQKLTDQALQTLEPFGPRAEILKQLASAMLDRTK